METGEFTAGATKAAQETTKLKNAITREMNAAKKEIQSLYNKYLLQKFNSIERTQEDWDTISAIESSDLYYREDNGTISYYFFMNKGQDLKEVIHELAIDSLNSLSLPFNSGLVWYPQKNINFHYQEEYCCIGKIGNIEKLKDITKHIFDEKLIINKINYSQNLVELTFNGDQHSIQINDLLCGIWGPNKYSDFQQFSKDIYISGLDSI